VFTMERFGCSRWRDARTIGGDVPPIRGQTSALAQTGPESKTEATASRSIGSPARRSSLLPVVAALVGVLAATAVSLLVAVRMLHAPAATRSEATSATVEAQALTTVAPDPAPALLLWFLGAMSVGLIAVSCFDPRGPAIRSERAPIPEGRPSPMPTALRAAYVAAVQGRAPEEYRCEPAAEGFHAESAAQGLRAELRADGVEVAPRAGSWAFRPAPSRWGCDGALADVERAAPEIAGNRATYRRAGFDQWYVSGELGLEQGRYG
jgi:hypothetical protein